MFAHMAFVRDILIGAEKRGANLKAMCDTLDINPPDLYHSDLRVTFEQAYRAWEVAISETGDHQLGLHLGEQTNASILGLVGLLMQSSPNLEEAFKSVCNFSHVASDMFAYTFSVKKDEAILSYRPCTPWLKVSPMSARQGVEQAMSATLNIFAMLSGVKIVPNSVHLTYTKPRHIMTYERIFRAPVKWNASSNSLIFSREQLMRPILSYDESMMGLFCELIKKRISKLKSETFVTRVKQEIMTTFMGQIPSIESMAARFNMTVRSFQRKLEEENASYRVICSDLGKDFAASLLSNKRATVKEVASTLGYTNPRAFNRAFKSWTGQTPGEFRELL
jgi:AraC-like DNA-binding protein